MDPKSVINQISAIISKFLWKASKHIEKKFHMVHWNIFQLLKVYGRLEIKYAYHMNLVLGRRSYGNLSLNLKSDGKCSFYKSIFIKNDW